MSYLKNCGNGSILVRFFFEKNRKYCVRATRMRKIHIFKKNPLPTVKNHKITIPKHPTDCNYLQRRRRNHFWHFITFSVKSQKIVILSRLSLERTHFPIKIYTLTHNHLPTVKNHKITIPKRPTDCNYLERRRRNHFWHFLSLFPKNCKKSWFYRDYHSKNTFSHQIWKDIEFFISTFVCRIQF